MLQVCDSLIIAVDAGLLDHKSNIYIFVDFLYTIVVLLLLVCHYTKHYMAKLSIKFFFVFNIIFVILSSLNESFIWFSLISRSILISSVVC